MVTQQKIPERFWCVKGIDIFRDLAKTDADALARITTFVELKHGDTLSAEGVYLLKEGRIKIYQTPPEGEATHFRCVGTRRILWSGKMGE